MQSALVRKHSNEKQREKYTSGCTFWMHAVRFWLDIVDARKLFKPHPAQVQAQVLMMNLKHSVGEMVPRRRSESTTAAASKHPRAFNEAAIATKHTHITCNDTTHIGGGGFFFSNLLTGKLQPGICSCVHITLCALKPVWRWVYVCSKSQLSVWERDIYFLKRKA